MKNMSHIVALAILFLATVFGLGALHFWELAGIEHPEGLVFQGVLFFALYVALKTFLFEPYLNVLDERELQTTGKLKSVEESQERSKKMLAQYSETIAQARLNAIRERERLAIEAENSEKQKLSQAKSESLSYLESKTKENNESAQAVRAQLSPDVGHWADEIVKKVSSGSHLPQTMERVAATGS